MHRGLLSRVTVATARLVAQDSAAFSAHPFPADEPMVHSAGPDPDRLLFFGGGPIAGIGVSSHRSSIVGQCARQVSTLTGRGVDAEVIADDSTTIRSALDAIATVRLARFDAIIIAVGINDVILRTSLRAWTEGLAALLDQVQAGVPSTCCVFLLAIGDPAGSPMFRRSIASRASSRSREFNRATQRLVASRAGVTYLPFRVGPVEPGPQAYTVESHVRWASQLSGTIAEDLDREFESGSRRGSYRADAEADRQAAVESLQVLDTAPEDRFDRIVKMASVLLKSTSAVLAIIDNDRVWLKSRVGVDIAEVDRSASLCTTTITERGGLLVVDASMDPRFSSSPLVTGELHLRYYQGYPVESTDGFPVGALCVFGTEPRTPAPNSMNVLRDLALLIQVELAR